MGFRTVNILSILFDLSSTLALVCQSCRYCVANACFSPSAVVSHVGNKNNCMRADPSLYAGWAEGQGRSRSSVACNVHHQTHSKSATLLSSHSRCLHTTSPLRAPDISTSSSFFKRKGPLLSSTRRRFTPHRRGIRWGFFLLGLASPVTYRTRHAPLTADALRVFPQRLDALGGGLLRPPTLCRILRSNTRPQPSLPYSG